MPKQVEPLNVSGLVKTFPGRSSPLLDQLEITVSRGEMVALLGPNGCGKTTLLRCLAGILPFGSGSVQVAGVRLDVRDGRAKGQLGYVPDDHPIRLKLSVREYLTLCAALQGLEEPRANARIDELIEYLRLGEFQSLFLEACSHGITKRVTFAAALLHRPLLLLLDEPESGLDSFAFGGLTRELEAHRDAGGAVLVATHNADWAQRRCDRVVRLEEGRLQPLSGEQLAALAV